MRIDKIIIINLNLISIIQECSLLFITYGRGKISGKTGKLQEEEKTVQEVRNEE